MIQDYKVEGCTRNTTGSNFIYTGSRDQALKYARAMTGADKWERVVIWKDGRAYPPNEWKILP